MFKSSSVRLSALSKRTKRVKVQILKDFPQFLLYRGEVAQVKSSLMRNYLHNYNGARYILHDSDINVDLLKLFEKRQEELKSAKSNFAAKKHDTQSAQSPTAIASTSIEVPVQPPSEAGQPKKPKGVLEKDITVKDVKIPGLDI